MIIRFAIGALLTFALILPAREAGAVTIGLTPAQLGLLGDNGALGTEINHGSDLIADQPGLREGAVGVAANILEIRLDGGVSSADDAANGNHLVTITGETHTDVTDNLPVGNDYLFGILSADPGSSASNIGGLGMRAFKVDTVTGVRTVLGGKSQLDADIEGSKQISGGTSGTDFLVEGNGPPHVDEVAVFDFDGDLVAVGDSLSLVLTDVKFDNKDAVPLGLRVLLSVSVIGEGTTDTVLESLVDTLIMTTDDNGNITVHFNELFDAVAGLDDGDLVDSFSLSALDDDVELANLKETAEHFLINSFSGTFVPEPSTALLLASGLIGLTFGGRRHRA